MNIGTKILKKKKKKQNLAKQIHLDIKQIIQNDQLEFIQECKVDSTYKKQSM